METNLFVVLLQLLAVVSAPVVFGSVVSSCTVCTSLNASARWCPVDMSCQSADRCACSGADCLNFTSCFVQESSCVECIRSGGMFCVDEMDGGNSCVFPEMASGDRSCVSLSSECPPNAPDEVLTGWITFCCTLSVVIVVLMYANGHGYT